MQSSATPLVLLLVMMSALLGALLVSQYQMWNEIQRLRTITEAVAEMVEITPEDTTGEDFNSSRIIPLERVDRRLGGIFSVSATAGGGTATTGCYSMNLPGTAINLNSAGCNSNRCPGCFILENGNTNADATQTFNNVGSAYWKSAAFTGVREYMFINLDEDNTLTIADGNRNFKLAPYQMAYATVRSGVNYFIWTSNYGIGMKTTGGNDVLTCPDGCDSATAKLASDPTTALSAVWTR